MTTINAEHLANDLIGLLPDCSRTTGNEIGEKLFSAGLNTRQRLSIVTKEDLEDFLLPFQIRIVLNSWKCTPATLPLEVASAAPVEPVVEPQVLNKRNGTMLRRFHIDWNNLYKINKKIKGKLESGKMLKKKEKLEVVKRLVNQVRENVPHATRDLFVEVTRQLKKKYPLTFQSALARGKVNKLSLAKRMKDKFDNDKRDKRRTTTEKEAPAIKAEFGCTKWRLATLPQGETKQTQEEKREALLQEYEEKRPAVWDLDEIEQKMAITYATQRADINTQALQIAREVKKAKSKETRENEQQEDDDPAMTTLVIRDRWPFLFYPRFMLQHFLMLTGKNLQELFVEFLDRDGPKILEFLLETTKKKKHTKRAMIAAQKEHPSSKSPILAAILIFLLKRFKEKTKALWLIVADFAREDDIPNLVEIPSTPCLVVAGESVFTATDFYFTLDGDVITAVSDFLEGIYLVFASYYVFNMEYAGWAQITLEFLQRCVANIDPEKGNKRPPKEKGGNHSTRRIHPSLTSLHNKYDDFLAEKQSEDDDENEESEN